MSTNRLYKFTKKTFLFNKKSIGDYRFVTRRFYTDITKRKIDLESVKCIKKIIYNEILLANENEAIEADARSKLSSIRARPLCLKYLREETSISEKSENSISDENNYIENSHVGFPFKIEKKFIKDDSESQVFPEQMINFTPSDNFNETVPELNKEAAIIESYIDENEEIVELVNDNIDNVIMFGSSDPSVPHSRVPCGGCGALLHCTNKGIPGFIPKEVFKKLNNKKLKSQICQRCFFLKEFNIALGINVHPDEYPKILSVLRNKKALIILIIDLLDFPCSLWSGISEIIGSKPVIIVGNKIDLLIQENKDFEKTMKKSLLDILQVENINIRNVIDIFLISAKTGYQIEPLISCINEFWRNRGDIYLVGCTNVGKSTLFNSLIKTDICRSEAEHILRRATISTWPGTTLNLLKFPVKRLYGELLYERFKNFVDENKRKRIMKKLKNVNQMVYQSPLKGTLQKTVLKSKKRESEVEDFTCVASFTEPNERVLDSDDSAFAFCRWFYDTPGVVEKDQITNLLTTFELNLTLPKAMLLPRNFFLKPGFSLFIGGLSRLDYHKGSSKVWFTVFASKELPITVTKTEDADDVYNKMLGSELFRVPCGTPERLAKWPKLKSKEFEVCGRNINEASADIVLSSAGWIAVTLKPAHFCQIEVWTPEGRGIYLRPSPMISRGHLFKGQPIPDTPAYRVSVKEVEQYTS